jgi:predicted PurR-regulated permease PerM
MSADLSVIGIVFAIILFIIFFAAVILYLSFRIKETFREEKKRGMLAVKIGFLIGILFLAGGSFYFFAQILTSSTTPNPSIPSNGNGELKPELTLALSYPATTRMSTQITLTLTITNPTNMSAHDVIVQTNSLFEDFTLISSTHERAGNIIKLGTVAPGTIVSSLELLSPSRPIEFSETIGLTFTEMTEQVTKSISISVSGGPQ